MTLQSAKAQTGLIAGYKKRLDAAFRGATTKREAHSSSAPVMRELTADAAFLTEVLSGYVSQPESLNRGNYPVVTIKVDSNPYYDLVVHCWIPLPSGETDISTKSIHHHGELMLTTGTMFGPGYEHWMLDQPILIDPPNSVYSMRLVGHGVHSLHELAFVDSYVAHVPLYPSSLTITVCLWSSRSQKSWKDTLKRVEFLQRHSTALRQAAVRIGLKRALDLKVVDTYDFHPIEGGFRGIKERREFPLGSNEDHLHSLFHVVQNTGNEHLASIIEEQLDRGTVEDERTVRHLLDMLRTGEPIDGRLSDGHYGVPEANFRRSDIERALATQPA
jgi:hypothetical protein